MVVLAASSLVSNMNAEASGSMIMLLYAQGSVRWSDLSLGNVTLDIFGCLM